MAHIKDRQRQIPHGYRFFQPETGWDSRKVLGSMPSLEALAQALIQHRRGNPYLAKQHGWKMTEKEVIEELDAYNAKICADHGWTDFISFGTGDPAPPKPVPPLGRITRNLSEGVAAIKVGAQTMKSWFGEGMKPVAHDEAERRAAICAICPQNDKGDWTRWFTQPASELIRKQLAAAKGLNLTTSKDAELKVCIVCKCPLALKVFTPLEHIVLHMDDTTKAKLDPGCWITK